MWWYGWNDEFGVDVFGDEFVDLYVVCCFGEL